MSLKFPRVTGPRRSATCRLKPVPGVDSGSGDPLVLRSLSPFSLLVFVSSPFGEPFDPTGDNEPHISYLPIRGLHSGRRIY